MQQGITRREAYEPSLTATIGGRDVELASASMDRMLPDPVMSDSLTAASGSLVAVDGPDVVSTVATPWDPGSVWPPVPETPASVRMGTGSGLVSLLGNGRVMSADGGSSGREVGVEVADQYQSLDKSISWDAVAGAMPPLQWDWDRRRYVSMNSVAVTDMILRHCGWYSTPPNLSWIALSVPGQGTMWPERGTVEWAGRRSLSNLAGYPTWTNAPWGIGVSDFQGDYRLTGTQRTIKGQGRMELTAMVTVPSDYSRMEVTNAAGNGLVRLTWTSTQVRVEVRGGAGSFINTVALPITEGFVYATIRYYTDTQVDVFLHVGAETATARFTVDPLVTTTVGETARIISTGASAGFQVAYPTTSGALAGWVPNAQIRPRVSQRNFLEVLPSMEGGNCADLLAQQCEAEAATYWIDETGVLQWWDLARLEGRSSVATLTSDDDIAEPGFTWAHSHSSRKSRAAVKWRQPLREWKANHGVTLYQGSGKTMSPGDDNVEEWLNTPNDEVWIMPDLSLDRLGTDNMTDFNYGHGSAYGGVLASGDSDVDRWANPPWGSLLMTVERVTDRAFKMFTSWNSTRSAVLRTPSEAASSALWRVRRNFDLPIIRGKAKFMFTDRVTYSAQSGPQTAPERTIDADWWIQDAGQAQYVADYYGARVTIPQPVLSSVALIPVPGLQLGDMVEVRDEAVTRLTIRGLIVADSKAINADMGLSHAVAIRPLYVTRNGVTWEMWGSVVAGDQWSDWGSRQAGKTYQQWGANPLLGEDVL